MNTKCLSSCVYILSSDTVAIFVFVWNFLTSSFTRVEICCGNGASFLLSPSTMIELKFRLILVCVVWGFSSDWAQCSNDFHEPKSNRVLDECKRLCRDPSPTEIPLEDSHVSIF